MQKIVNVGGNPSAGSGFGIGTSSTNTSSNLWGFAFQRTATPWGSGLSHGHATNLDLYNLSAGASIQQEPVAANLNNNISFRSSGTTQSNTNWLQYSALPTVNTEYQNAVTVSMTLGMVSTYKYGYDYGADNDYIRIYYTA